MLPRSRLPAVLLLVMSLLGAAHAKPPESLAIEPTGPGEAAAAVSPHARLMQFLLQGVEDPDQLRGYRVAILAADGVDGFDLTVPRHFLMERGATVHVIVPRPAKALEAAGSGAIVKPKTQVAVLDPSGEHDQAVFDRFVDQVQAQDYDVVYLPGNRGLSRELAQPPSVGFLQQAESAGTPIFAIGNGALALLAAGLLDERRATGDAATLERLATSSARATDAALVSDGPIHTSRHAFDMPALMENLIATLLTRPVAKQ
jgi:protease I